MLGMVVVGICLFATGDTRGQSPRSENEPRLPGAIVYPPAWLKDAPFDVAKFFAMPRPEENAAPLYIEALFEFGDMSLCYQGDQQARAEEARRREERARAAWNSWTDDPASVERSKLDSILKEHAQGFRKLKIAQARPRCVFATGLTYDSLLPHAQVARYAARLLAFRVDRDLDRGDFDDAIHCVESALRLSRDIRPRGSIICQIVSVAIDGIVGRTMIPLFLSHPLLETTHCDRLIAILVKHRAEAANPYRTAVESEYCMNLATARIIEQGFKVGADEQGRPIDRKTEHSDVITFVKQVIRDENKPEPDNAAVERSANKLAQYPKEWPRTVQVFGEICRIMLRASAAHHRERRRAYAEAETRYTNVEPKNSLVFVRLLSPDYDKLSWACANDDFYLGSAEALLAVRRWQLTRPEVPDDLEAVYKSAKIQEKPRDPYGSSPLKMTADRDGIVIYSVGPDGKDDRALKDSDLGRKPEGDMLSRMPKVKPRGR
jgi:hypothetical protein